MTTLLTLYLAGMPCALVFLLWSLTGLPDEDWADLVTLPGMAALVVWVTLWPVFLAISIFDVMTEG